jgi:hypothetical protein
MRTFRAGIAALTLVGSTLILLVPGASAAALSAGSDSEAVLTSCSGPHPAGAWYCIARSSSSFGPSAGGLQAGMAIAPAPNTVTKTRYSWSFAETDNFGIGETLVSRVLWSGGINFDGRQGHVTGDLRLMVGAQTRTEFINDAFHNTGQLADTHVITDPSADTNFSSHNTMRGGWWPYFHGTKYYVTYQLHVWARGGRNPSTADGSFISEKKETPEFTCGAISGQTQSCYFP